MASIGLYLSVFIQQLQQTVDHKVWKVVWTEHAWLMTKFCNVHCSSNAYLLISKNITRKVRVPNMAATERTKTRASATEMTCVFISIFRTEQGSLFLETAFYIPAWNLTLMIMQVARNLPAAETRQNNPSDVETGTAPRSKCKHFHGLLAGHCDEVTFCMYSFLVGESWKLRPCPQNLRVGRWCPSRTQQNIGTFL